MTITLVTYKKLLSTECTKKKYQSLTGYCVQQGIDFNINFFHHVEEKADLDFGIRDIKYG